MLSPSNPPSHLPHPNLYQLNLRNVGHVIPIHCFDDGNDHNLANNESGQFIWESYWALCESRCEVLGVHMGELWVALDFTLLLVFSVVCGG